MVLTRISKPHVNLITGYSKYLLNKRFFVILITGSDNIVCNVNGFFEIQQKNARWTQHLGGQMFVTWYRCPPGPETIRMMTFRIF